MEFTMPYKRGDGVRRGKGGTRPGAGRKPEWFGVQCREIFEKREILDFIAGVAVGTEEKAMIRDRLRAAEMLKEWGYGRSTLPVAVNEGGQRIVLVRPGLTGRE